MDQDERMSATVRRDHGAQMDISDAESCRTAWGPHLVSRLTKAARSGVQIEVHTEGARTFGVPAALSPDWLELRWATSTTSIPRLTQSW